MPDQPTTAASDTVLRDMVIGFLRGYTGPPEVAADELIRMVRQWEPRFVQVGWYGPYGIIPGGMDNEPSPKWRPVYAAER